MEKTVLIYSGGLDSTTLLYYLLHKNYHVALLTFDYDQRHKKEILAAQKTVNFLMTKDFQKNITGHKIIDISSINSLIGGSSLTSDEISVPHGHYADENMKLTVVPNRNMIFLSLAIGYAVSINASSVSYAAHSGDHAIYPDCRPDFVEKIKQVANIANYQSIDILTPFLNMTKGEIVKKGVGFKFPVDYSKTWTCYEGKEKPCGKCGACVERLEAFEYAGIKDPLDYK
jgi:7-cyano-7-deazaguanine synthase